MNYFKNIVGRRSGKLVAIKLIGFNERRKNTAIWECLCDCGNIKNIEGRLLSGKSGIKSCGCILKEKNKLRPVRNSTNLTHGESGRKSSSKTPEYISWSSMIQRCCDTKHSAYTTHGAIGISVCERWRKSYVNFLEDMGRKPNPKYSIDRIDTKGNYEKSNCRWASNLTQQNNKSNNRIVIYDGIELTCSQMAIKLSIPERNIYNWADKSFPGNDISAYVLRYLSRPRID